VSNPTCNGAANGSINLTVNGATGNLNFDWNVNAIDGLQNPTALSAGTYSVTVTDAANCTASTSISLTQPAALAIVCGQQNPVSVIGGSDGSATVQIAGGTAAYSIAWSGAASGSQNQAAAGTATITGLVSGNYSLTVTDANGCQQTCNFSIGAPNCNITLQISGTNPTCNGAANGSINLTVNGATGNLNFDWNVNAIDGLQNPTALSTGTYSVTVTDAANCTASTSIALDTTRRARHRVRTAKSGLRHRRLRRLGNGANCGRHGGLFHRLERRSKWFPKSGGGRHSSNNRFTIRQLLTHRHRRQRLVSKPAISASALPIATSHSRFRVPTRPATARPTAASTLR
jgi:hypothetical protein